MRGWMNDDKVMITCCNDGTRPVSYTHLAVALACQHLRVFLGIAAVFLQVAFRFRQLADVACGINGVFRPSGRRGGQSIATYLSLIHI